MDRLLAKYPQFLEEVKKAKGQVSRENLRNAVYTGFLFASYGLLAAAAAPVAFAAMIASHTLAPVLVGTTVIFIVP
jgi:hypothetical protein